MRPRLKALHGRLGESARRIDGQREQLAGHVETLSMATGIASGVATIAATLAAPTGLAALSVWLGLEDTPLLVQAAPVMAMIATLSGILSGAAYFYCRWRRRHLA